MLNRTKQRNSGFTIIEVMIVLAIGGLIMLVVFLAVPALQRNSRNTQRKSDVSAALGALQEYTTNNNGQLPPNVATAMANARFGFFNIADFTGSTTNATVVASVTPNVTGVIIQNFAKCPATVPATGAVAANTQTPTRRNVAAFYVIETSSGTQNQCTDM